MRKYFAILVFALSALIALSGQNAAASTRATIAEVRDIGKGAWSYFGDPRSVSKGQFIFTGFISTGRWVTIDRFNYVSGQHKKFRLRQNDEMDDHDNPSLVFFKGHLCAFASPHSGYVYPLNRKSAMRYWCSRRSGAGIWGFGRSHRVPLGSGCGLGYTYPNPVVAGSRLFLFMRGPCWYPYYTSTTDGVHWSKPRTLVFGPSHDGRNERPYAKYSAGPDGSIHMIFSDGHPHDYRNSLYYARMKNGRLYKANGKLIGSVEKAPFRLNQFDRVYRFSRSAGRAWPHDVAILNKKPVVVYTLRTGGPGGIDYFHYARWANGHWADSPIVSAGKGYKTFNSGGASFNHANPDWLVLSRTPMDADVASGLYKQTRWNQVELWHTLDSGKTWSLAMSITGGATASTLADESAYNIRPVIPRGFTDPSRLVVVYDHGDASSFRSFASVIRLRMESVAP